MGVAHQRHKPDAIWEEWHINLPDTSGVNIFYLFWVQLGRGLMEPKEFQVSLSVKNSPIYRKVT